MILNPTHQESRRCARASMGVFFPSLWVLKSGLNMPNEASFSAIILEDPIMKASHYDGYARSQRPPIPLMQVPGAVEAYAKYDGKSVLLEATKAL